jgi:hypothetical protein
VLWGHTDPGHVDDMLGTFRMSIMPKMEELPGFASCNLMVDRSSGRMTMAITYDSADMMRQADERADSLRQESFSAMGWQLDEKAEFDLVLAHLRVPETV